ncbi:MAG: hypothetical protein KDD50_16100, partial [Bdellovibrionales bacterium]|nr:hypothetical protein [Bdellovibrionales bacterium]
CLMSGMNGFIGKPLSPSDLVEAISRINPKVKSRLSSYNLKDSLSLSAQKKIAQSFVLTLKELNTKLNQPLSLEELKKIGHQYKSSSKLLGEHQFSESCLLLENASSLSQALSVSKKIQADIPDVISHQIV